MVELEAETTVDASPETVFEFIAVPKNHPKILPSLVEISNVDETDVGKRGRYVFKMVGQSMKGQFFDIEFDRPNRRAYEMTGDIVGTVTWTIEESNGGSYVHYHQETEPPETDLLDTITEPIARTFLQREADTMVENLRTLVEEGIADTPWARDCFSHCLRLHSPYSAILYHRITGMKVSLADALSNTSCETRAICAARSNSWAAVRNLGIS